MPALVTRLSSQRWLHHALAALRAYPAAEAALRLVPLQRRAPGGGRYRITSLDQLGIEAEVFRDEVYRPVLAGAPVRTFIDCGANAGWFAVWLAARQGRADLCGLLVEAHPRLAGEAEWHLRANALAGCSVVPGAVAAPAGCERVTFHLLPSSSQSSLAPYEPGPGRLPLKGRVRTAEVPAVRAGVEWARRFGDRRVDLLKLDVEGAELDFVRLESEFLRDRVDRLAIEWHRWRVDPAQLDGALGELRFERTGSAADTQASGVAFYSRTG